MPIEKKYGSWISPIKASILEKSEMNYTYLCQDQCDDVESMIVYWIELRSAENGRSVVVSRDVGILDSENVCWTKVPFSARTKVHEYGGADMFVHRGIVYFSNNLDQHLYMQVRKGFVMNFLHIFNKEIIYFLNNSETARISTKKSFNEGGLPICQWIL